MGKATLFLITETMSLLTLWVSGALSYGSVGRKGGLVSIAEQDRLKYGTECVLPQQIGIPALPFKGDNYPIIDTFRLTIFVFLS